MLAWILFRSEGICGKKRYYVPLAFFSLRDWQFNFYRVFFPILFNRQRNPWSNLVSGYAFCTKQSLNKWENFVRNEEQSWLASHPISRAWPSPGTEFPEPGSTRDLPWTHLGIVQEHKVRELQFHGAWTWDICIMFCNGTWVMWARVFLSWWRQLQFSHLLDSYPVSETLKKKWW